MCERTTTAMSQDDWNNLSRLGELSDAGRLSAIGRDNYYTLLHRTEREESHPETHDGPCLCELCKSYS